MVQRHVVCDSVVVGGLEEVRVGVGTMGVLRRQKRVWVSNRRCARRVCSALDRLPAGDVPLLDNFAQKAS